MIERSDDLDTILATQQSLFVQVAAKFGDLRAVFADDLAEAPLPAAENATEPLGATC
jgi:hypothetical protein